MSVFLFLVGGTELTMGVLNQFLFIGLLLAGGVALNFFMLITRHMSAPELDCNEYWGAGNVSNYRPIQLIRPANITIPIEVNVQSRSELIILIFLRLI